MVAEELSPDLEVVRFLGGGSVTSVYLAREPALRRLVAVKVLNPRHARDPKARLRFHREAQSAARISHPHIVSVYRVGEIRGEVPYLVMRYVRGPSLADRLAAQGPLPVVEACRIVADVASALEAAHGLGILHRDVKASNVLYEEASGNVFLTDFGLAGILASGDQPQERLTTAGHIIGDMAYLSPEQLRGEEPTDRVDVYGLGLLAYELLTGCGPFDSANVQQTVAGHLTQDPEPLVTWRAEISPDIDDVTLRCLAKDPNRRPRAGDVAARLARLGATQITKIESDLALEQTTSEPSAEAARAAAFRLKTLGSLELFGPDGRSVMSVLAQPKRAALLAYLAVGGEGGFKRRDELIGVFWPDAEPDRGRHALRQSTYVLRRALGSDVLRSRGDEELGVSGASLECDAVLFEQAARSGEDVRALGLYAGDLLPGFYLSDSPEFEHWLDQERLRLQRLAAGCAWRVAEATEAEGNKVEAGKWACKAVELTPLDEGTLHRLIELLDRTGDRSGAVRAYEHFARRLAEEYETQPSSQTQALIARVRNRE